VRGAPPATSIASLLPLLLLLFLLLLLLLLLLSLVVLPGRLREVGEVIRGERQQIVLLRLYTQRKVVSLHMPHELHPRCRPTQRRDTAHDPTPVSCAGKANIDPTQVFEETDGRTGTNTGNDGDVFFPPLQKEDRRKLASGVQAFTRSV
jgi:hypothetical protein